ncbi:hypothetical protein [Massilia genomosp. 1]|uniref:Uncharacterized protein n=1 Tax=Massilia genomosp. 1 TaxID=2609280 RepID=A0ABX0N8X3_9BURK|nr:hypothetical protein [Massilia genomosp. 1]NHZ66609.1 hypothetical protein [Massilia genomosp. 1]
MSSQNQSSGDTARGTDRPSPASATPDESGDQAARTVPPPSYSTHFHLSYVTTVHTTGKIVEDRKVHQILYTYRPEAGTSNSVPQARMAITCQIESEGKHEQLRLRVDSPPFETGLVSAPEVHLPGQKPESSDDALKSIRERRTAVLKEMFGIWKDRDDIPEGLQFQKAMRDEWG